MTTAGGAVADPWWTQGSLRLQPPNAMTTPQKVLSVAARGQRTHLLPSFRLKHHAEEAMAGLLLLPRRAGLKEAS